jgi:hypothetical protein
MATIKPHPPSELAPRDLWNSYANVLVAISNEQDLESKLRLARHQTSQLALRYEELLLEHQGQLPLPWENVHASGGTTTPHRVDHQR